MPDEVRTKVALEEGCLKEFEDQEKIRGRRKPTRSIGRRRLFSTIRVRGPSHIGLRRGERGSKFPKIDVFVDVYVRHRDELAKSFHVSILQL
ncbi:uncharacterized protein LOC103957778 isoform X2 [Pyrus x bretschneideri]|uniref:uncharacterized protein LOC103957778 isoform X2 n=1 Tax=Pyrus x bretschneideri TaxID=225117 RepID=UPI00202E48EE|nr:uncharacterized protein LOC103957778 isoform X2 [Pyrus x bretschneideri]XP_048430903.1 uncharacterized protein LOC103957778 isoform X2 [Pyrus x bretschneideri]